jgi:uncharacterized membrane protein YqgA involved in biofilm formation
MILFGTLINVATVLAGSVVGYFFNARIPENLLKIAFQAIGLFTLYIGITMAMKSQELLILIFSLILGSIVGEWMDINRYIVRLGDWINKKTRFGGDHFSEGMVTAFLLFCMGSMTILGAFQEGTANKSDLLIAKSVMDGFSSLALASTLGIGVAFSIFPLVFFQGGLTLLSAWLGNQMPETVIHEMSAAGGLILVGLGLSILEIKQIKVVIMRPGLLFAILFGCLY